VRAVASPQLENGYTPIANELLEAVLRTPLTSREAKCLLAVARETYGWSRKAKRVTAYRVALLTGIGRTKAARALHDLKARNILANGSEGVGLQKDYHRWIVLPRSNPDRVQVGPGPVRTGSDPNPTPRSNPDRVTRSKLDPHKTRKQESKNDTPPNRDHQAVMAEYDRLFRGKVGTAPHITGRDGAIVKRLLQQHPVGEVIELLRGYFRVGTRYSREQGTYNLAFFATSFNDLAVMRAKGDL
jgi:phage replication O-like protein O